MLLLIEALWYTADWPLLSTQGRAIKLLGSFCLLSLNDNLSTEITQTTLYEPRRIFHPLSAIQKAGSRPQAGSLEGDHEQLLVLNSFHFKQLCRVTAGDRDGVFFFFS